jgi:hypothetical protein
VAATTFNLQRQMTGRIFQVPNPGCIEPVEPGDGSVHFDLPLTSLDSLFRVEAEAPRTRVRVRGTVTMAEPGRGIFLRSNGVACWVGTAQPSHLRPGDLVDVAGWPHLGDFQPELRTAIFRRVGEEAPPAPKPVKMNSILAGEEEANLISLRAELIDQSDAIDGCRMILRSDGTIRGSALGKGGRFRPPAGRQWEHCRGRRSLPGPAD